MFTTFNPNTEELNVFMDFDLVVEVTEDGIVQRRHDKYAPEMDGEEILSSVPWQFVNGFSRQYGYSGPAMHPSEYIGGGLEEHILTTPGFYTVVILYPTLEEQLAELEDDEELGNAEPYGWAVLFLDPDDDTNI